MARHRYSDEDASKLLREIDVHLHDGLDVVSACRKAGISDKTYYGLVRGTWLERGRVVAWLLAMTKSVSFKYFKTSPEIIRLAVTLYIRFPLSLRNVEDLLHERGIDVSHETVRYWWNRFGPMFAYRRYMQRLDDVLGNVDSRCPALQLPSYSSRLEHRYLYCACIVYYPQSALRKRQSQCH